MPKREVSLDAIRKPVGVFSQATVVEAKGKLVFISGMTARRPDGSIAGIGDISAQTRQVCENIKAAVEAAGGTLKDVAFNTIFLNDLANYAGMNEVYREFFPSEPPARYCIRVDLVKPEFLVEIASIAHLA